MKAKLSPCYTEHMEHPRDLPLYDDSLKRGTWNERMVPGEYAVHYSSFIADGYNGLFCTILGSLNDAVDYAQQQVQQRPDLRCTIYNHDGFVGAPVEDIRGREFKDKDSLSPRFRRWVGAILFFGGLILTIVDWWTDFALSWPAMIGTRMIIPGFGLLLMDIFITLNERHKRKELSRKSS
jgi:hypothetical protein